MTWPFTASAFLESTERTFPFLLDEGRLLLEDGLERAPASLSSSVESGDEGLTLTARHMLSYTVAGVVAGGEGKPLGTWIWGWSVEGVLGKRLYEATRF
jgi:hypothetical protein